MGYGCYLKYWFWITYIILDMYAHIWMFIFDCYLNRFETGLSFVFSRCVDVVSSTLTWSLLRSGLGQNVRDLLGPGLGLTSETYVGPGFDLTSKAYYGLGLTLMNWGSNGLGLLGLNRQIYDPTNFWRTWVGLPPRPKLGKEIIWVFTKILLFLKGETSLTPLKFHSFCRYPPNVQKLSLRCIKLCFSLTLPIPYKFFFTIPILPPTPTLHRS
jgi:hypothetical protein